MMDPQKIIDSFHNYSVHRETALYAKTGRPIHAWMAYRWIREAGLPVPPWFLEYLDECAEQLDKIDPKSPEQVAASFAMDRKGRNASISSDQLAAVEHFWGLKKMNPDLADKEIFSKVAEARGVSDRYVEDAYYKWFPRN
jgi:hypothetical protein